RFVGIRVRPGILQASVPDPFAREGVSQSPPADARTVSKGSNLGRPDPNQAVERLVESQKGTRDGLVERRLDNASSELGVRVVGLEPGPPGRPVRARCGQCFLSEYFPEISAGG